METGAKIKLPNFVIAGAAKAGSTSLYHYLKQHPEIYLPEKVKESRFLANEKLKDTLYYNRTSILNYSDFKALYTGASNHKAVGDLGNVYLFYPQTTTKNIKYYLGENVKILIVLRNPVDRAFSAYQFACRNMFESEPFEICLKNEDKRVQKYKYPPDIFFYKKYGLYYKNVKYYLDNFENVKIVLSEDLRDNTYKELEEIFAFLGINKEVKIPKLKIHNQGGWVPSNLKIYNTLFNGKKVAKRLRPIVGKSPVLLGLGQQILLSLEKLRNKLIVKKPIHLKEETRLYLISYFEKDIKALEKLLNKNLSRWLR